jgi:hypothetical protein
MRIACFDGFSGASGDMILGALLDAGAPLDALQAGLSRLAVTGFSLDAEPIRKQGLAATQVTVTADDPQPHRHLSDIVKLIDGSDLPQRPAEQAKAIFERLADAEASVHGTTRERIHFHEVGAVDAIVDIVGACLALDLLGIDRIHATPLVVGSGTVTCAHGTLPVPAPATAALLEGFPIATSDEVGELTTPTGAAILTTLADAWGPLPAMTVGTTGFGSGRREGRTRPNVLRVLLGETTTSDSTDEVIVLETQLDDQTPEVTGHAAERLLEAGALDVFAQPIYMKKGRPGTLLTVLCHREQVGPLERMIFAETTTFGIRQFAAKRRMLDRRHDHVALDGMSVGIKVGSLGSSVMTASPEFEDCRTVAERTGKPLKDVMAAAMAAWQDATLNHPEGAGDERLTTG